MSSHGHSHEGGESCSCALASGGVAQTMDEMEFERGIWSAAMDGEEEKVKRLLVSGTSPNAADSAGYTPLHYASRSGHAHICQLLLSSGASANVRTPGGGATPLHRAAYCGHTNVVKLLLEHGAEAGVVDEDGMTALHKAAEKGHYSVADVLVQWLSPSSSSSSLRRALIITRDKRGRTAKDLVRTLDSTWEQLLRIS